MKRSQINRSLEIATNRLEEFSFRLPAFAYWTPDEWRERAASVERVIANGLGWDITDFGSEDFEHVGAVLFTLRNGNYKCRELGTPYAEKVIILTPGQEIPNHFHWHKTEDIINRGGGTMVIELWNAADDESVDRTSGVRVWCDGIVREVPAGGTLQLEPGESITLTPMLYHRFWASGGVLICGEISSINDDASDNRFETTRPRFAVIEEDEAPVSLLCNEYPGANG